MPRLPLKATALTCALALGTLAATYDPAEAGRRHYRGHSSGGVAAAAIAGIAVGAIIAGSASRRSYYEPDYYYAPPPPRRYYAPAYSSYAPAPWTPEWYDYCSRKYVSFNAYDGTFQPYYGPRRLCR